MLKKFGAVLILLVILLSIAPAGSPVKLSYVYSDSMAPTIETNEGFILIPAGAVEPGDVVTFRSSDRGEYVTHRIVGRTDAGYLTRGDNNPTTDQAAGAAPVDERAIVGKVLTIDGAPLTIPYYGVLVATLLEHERWFLGVLAGVLVLERLNGRRAPTPSARAVTRVVEVLRPAFVACLVAMVALILLGSTVHTAAFVAVATPSDAPRTLTVDEAHTSSMVLNRSAAPLTHQVVSARGATVTNESRNGSSIAFDLRIPPASTPGVKSVRIGIYRYPAVLPRPMLERLHRIHPIVPAGLTAGIVLVPVYLLSSLLVDRKAILRPSRNRSVRRIRDDSNGNA